MDFQEQIKQMEHSKKALTNLLHENLSKLDKKTLQNLPNDFVKTAEEMIQKDDSMGLMQLSEKLKALNK